MKKETASAQTTNEQAADISLIRRYLAGDAAAFDLLYERYRRVVYGYLNNFCAGRKEVVDDVYQQAWIKALNHLPRYRDSNSFMAWIIRIARNSAVDYFRRYSRFSGFDGGEERLPDLGESPLQTVVRRQDETRLTREIGRLPAEQREVVLLRLRELPFKEIAKIQGVSINTALGRMRYAILALREGFEAAESGTDGAFPDRGTANGVEDELSKITS